MSRVFNQQRGFSLVELMVSLVIGLLLLVGVLQAFIGGKETYTMQSALAKLQENGRFAMSFIANDLRRAGYMGCSRNASFNNMLRDASNAIPAFLNMNVPVRGVEAGGANNSDSIRVIFADADSSCDISEHNTATRAISCAADHEFANGDIVLATDCQHSAIFQIDSIGGGDDVGHQIVGGSNIRNCSANLRINSTSPSCASTSVYAFEKGTVMGLSSFNYYIATNNFGEPALFRDALTVISGNNVTVTANELVEGVEEMQILYGQDTDGNGTANFYVPADEVTSFNALVSVRISLLLQSIENSVVRDGQTVTFMGANVNYTDGRLRKVFTSTIALRNRL